MKRSDEKFNGIPIFTYVKFYFLQCTALFKTLLHHSYTIRNYYKLNIMDLSKACGCLSLDLLIAKLAAYGFGNMALALIADYLSNSNFLSQHVKVGAGFGSYLKFLEIFHKEQY